MGDREASSEATKRSSRSLAETRLNRWRGIFGTADQWLRCPSASARSGCVVGDNAHGGPPALAAPDDEHEPKLLGIADGEWQSTIPACAAAVGKPPALLQAFFPLDRTADSNFVQVQVETADILGVTIYYEVTVDHLGALNRGELDDDLAATAAKTPRR